MTKAIIVAAMLLGAGSTVAIQAANGVITEMQAPATEAWQTLEADQLPQAVKDALTAKYSTQSVTAAFVKEVDGVKIYKVALTDNEGNNSEVLFNEQGETVTLQ